jgi:anti-sigma factor RsiW
MITGIFKYLWARVASGRKSLSCREATDFLMAYVDGELPEPVRREFDLHLGVCSHCRTYLQSYKQTVAMGKAACRCDHAEASEQMPEDLVKAILAASTGQAGLAQGDAHERPSDGQSLGPASA